MTTFGIKQHDFISEIDCVPSVIGATVVNSDLSWPGLHKFKN